MSRLLALCVLCSACAGQHAVRGVCAPEVQPWDASDLTQVSAAAWGRVLLRGTDHDCSGMPIVWTGTAADCAQPERGVSMDQLDPRHVRAEDVVVYRAGASHAWVWIKTGHVENDEVMGPLGLVKVDAAHGLVVRAVGTLRALPYISTITLRSLEGHAVVMVEAQNCAQQHATCRKEITLLTIDKEGRLQPMMLHAGNAGCVGMARMDAWRNVPVQATSRGSHGGAQSLLIEVTPRWRNDGLVLHEKSTVRHMGGVGDGQVVLQSQSDRVLTWRDGALWSADLPLATRVYTGLVGPQ